MTTTRQERVSHLLRQIASDVIQRELRDPELGFVTVTDADVSPDLRQARLYVTVLGDDEAKKKGMAALKRATSFVRREIGRRAGLRVVPEISFREDTAIERGTRVFELLQEVSKEESNAAEQDKSD